MALRIPEAARGRLHHIEIWVAEFPSAEASLGWLLTELGYVVTDRWPSGASYRGASEYIVIEAGPDVLPRPHDRSRPGINHLAFHAGCPAEVDAVASAATDHGWFAMFAEKYPHAGGQDHYAAYLENAGGFEVELVAELPN